MTALAARRRNRTIAAFAVGALAALLLPTLGWVAADALRTSTEGRDALAGLVELTVLPPTPAALVAVIDDSGKVASLAAIALAPQDPAGTPGGTVVVLPAGGDTFLPDGTRGRVGDAYGQGGLASLQSSVEGLLGVTFEVAAALDAEEIARALPVAPVEFNLERPLADDQAGVPTELLPSGPTSLDATGIGQLLSAASVSESEAVRLPSIDAFWRAVSDKVGNGLGVEVDSTALPSDPERVTDPARLASLLTSLLRGPVQVHTLTAEPVTDAEENPDRLDLLRLDTAEVTVVFATVAFSAVSPPNPTLSIYVRSPLGDPELTKAAVGRLILAGANVVLVTENPELDVPAWTLVEHFDANDSDEAEQYGAQLGTFTSQRSSVRLDGVDAIVTLGRSFDDTVAASPVVVPTTSTLPDDTSPPDLTGSTTG